MRKIPALVVFLFCFSFLIWNYFLRTDIKIIIINETEVVVEIANNEAKIKKGLSGRQKLGENRGMLFVFEEPKTRSFWMKDMSFPIDIIWVDEELKIVGIEKNILPNTYPKTFESLGSIKYVLEVNAGWAEKHNVTVGERVHFEN